MFDWVLNAPLEVILENVLEYNKFLKNILPHKLIVRFEYKAMRQICSNALLKY